MVEKYEDIQITGAIGKPEIARSNRSNQLFFVNKRYIKDKTLTAATEQAYKGLIPIGKFGFVVLNMQINPAKVDVNVHPAKLEVRFEEENKVFQSIYHAIKDTLLKNELVAETVPNRRELTFEERLNNVREARKENQSNGLFGFRRQNEKQIQKYTEQESQIKTNKIEEKFKPGNPVNTEDVLEQLKQMKEEKVEEKGLEEDEEEYQLETTKPDKQVTDNFNEMYTKMFGTSPIVEKPKPKIENISVFEDIQEYNKPTYKFIGIVFNTYIILEIDKEMYILDQHAAHERIMYERVKENYYNEKNKNSQMLLIPDIVTLSHKEMETAKENIDMFEKAGFTLEKFGDNTIKINGVPTVCIDLDTKELFLETLDEINTVKRTSKQEKEEKFIATVACKAAVKANMALDEKEVTALMDSLLELPNPFTCPHGRPTVIKMSKYDIERKFARK